MGFFKKKNTINVQVTVNSNTQCTLAVDAQNPVRSLYDALSQQHGIQVDAQKHRLTAADGKDLNMDGILGSLRSTELRLSPPCSSSAASSSSSVSSSSSAIFGVPLADAVARNPHRTGIPLVVERCIEFLDNAAFLTEEGIFRLSGSRTEINQLQSQFDSGRDVTIPRRTDPNVAAGLLKQYLSMLPEPIMTYSLYDSFLNAARKMNRGSQEMLHYVQDLTGRLPEPNLNTLRALALFFNKLTLYANVNKMDAANVAIVLGPNIFKKSKDSDNDLVGMARDTPVINKITTYLVENATQVFNSAYASHVAGTRDEIRERRSIHIPNSHYPGTPDTWDKRFRQHQHQHQQHQQQQQQQQYNYASNTTRNHNNNNNNNRSLSSSSSSSSSSIPQVSVSSADTSNNLQHNQNQNQHQQLRVDVSNSSDSPSPPERRSRQWTQEEIQQYYRNYYEQQQQQQKQQQKQEQRQSRRLSGPRQLTSAQLDEYYRKYLESHQRRAAEQGDKQNSRAMTREEYEEYCRKYYEQYHHSPKSPNNSRNSRQWTQEEIQQYYRNYYEQQRQQQQQQQKQQKPTSSKQQKQEQPRHRSSRSSSAEKAATSQQEQEDTKPPPIPERSGPSSPSAQQGSWKSVAQRERKERERLEKRIQELEGTVSQLHQQIKNERIEYEDAILRAQGNLIDVMRREGMKNVPDRQPAHVFVKHRPYNL